LLTLKKCSPRCQYWLHPMCEVLPASKQRYTHYQRLAYNVFIMARKLRHYFAVHPIIVVNEAPLSNILNNPEATGHVSLWGIEISPWTSRMRKEKPSNHKYCQISLLNGSSYKTQDHSIYRALGRCISTGPKEWKVQEPEWC
jgi:hypothetical protein